MAILLTYLLLIQTVLAGLPPTTLSGQASSGKTTTFNYIVPNNQATTVTGGRLLETGNNNILSNPSFENSSLASASWDTSATTGTSIQSTETTVTVHGKQSLKFASSGGSSYNPSLVQDSTLDASQFAGTVQGLASCRIKSDKALVFATRSAGVTSTTNVISVPASNTWGLYKLPVILGATSNGISIVGTSSIAGTVQIDDCFLGAVDLKQDVDRSRIAGESYIAGTTNCTGWTSRPCERHRFIKYSSCPLLCQYC